LSTAKLHVAGPAHQARYSERFDKALADAIASSPDPAQATIELDDTALLIVLTHFAGAGRYDPADPPDPRTGTLQLLAVDVDAPRIRRFSWDWWHAGRALGRFVFAGTTLSPDQTVVADVVFEPTRP
jgi:hypothetical protein